MSELAIVLDCGCRLSPPCNLDVCEDHWKSPSVRWDLRREFAADEEGVEE